MEILSSPSDSTADAPRVVVVGDDLLMASRLLSALRARGIAVLQLRGEPLPAADVTVVDLNARHDVQMQLISSLRARDPAQTIIGFCSHTDRQRRRQAMACGASQVVTNDSLVPAVLRALGSRSARV